MRDLLALLLALPLAAAAQHDENALLWRISRAGTTDHAYLLGTVHSRDARAYAHIGPVLAAMDDCVAVFGELDLADAALFKTAGEASLFMPDGKTLEDLFTPRKYARVRKALREQIGPTSALMGRVKPIFLSAMLTEEAMTADSSQVLDQYLQMRASERGLRTGGLETPAEQLSAMDSIPLADQARMLYEAVRSKGATRAMERMLDAYADQDLERIGKLMHDGALSDGSTRTLIHERNALMAQRIDSIIPGGTTLFAIGAAHLPGEDGVLALLRGQGFQVAPVEDRTTDPR